MKIKKCVIAVAGMGTRMLPITKSVTKEMLTIVDVPAIYLQVKEAYLSGIKEIIFVVSKKNIKLIKSFFSKDPELMDFIKNEPKKLELVKELNEIIKKVTFHYVIERYPGSYGAVYSARNFLKDEYFGIMYGDDIIDADTPLLKQLIDECIRTDNMVIAAEKVDRKDFPSYGVIKYTKENIIDELLYDYEHKEDKGDIIHGRFIAHTKIFKVKDRLIKRKNNELHLPAAILLFQNEVRALLFEGQYFDIGSKIGLLKTNIHFALKKDEYKQELLEYLKEIK